MRDVRNFNLVCSLTESGESRFSTTYCGYPIRQTKEASVKDPYFKINKKTLYFDCTLEEYDFIPLLYVCKDTDLNRYLVFTTDVYKESYLIAPVSLIDLNEMLLGRIDIRSMFLVQPKLWIVEEIGINYENDIIKECRTAFCPDNLFPKEGRYYKMCDNAHKKYQKKIEAEIRRLGKTKADSAF